MMIQQQVLEPIVDDAEREELASIAVEMERLVQRLRELTERKDRLSSRYVTRPIQLGERL